MVYVTYSQPTYFLAKNLEQIKKDKMGSNSTETGSCTKNVPLFQASSSLRKSERQLFWENLCSCLKGKQS